MNFFANNIKYLRKQKGITQSDLANKLGINRPKIGSYEEGRAEPKLTIIQRIAHYYKVNIDDLLSIDLSKEVPKEKDVSGSALRVLPIIVNELNQEKISIVPVKAMASYLSGYADVEYIEKLPTLNLPLAELSTDRTYRIFQIQGDSMLPVVSGSYIIAEYVQNWSTIQNQSPCIVVSVNDGVVFKRVVNTISTKQSLVLNSDNQLYSPFEISIEEVLEVWQAKGIISFEIPETNDSATQINQMNTILLQLQQEMLKLKNQ